MASILTGRERATVEAYSRGEMTAIDARRRLDDATFGDLLRMLGEAGLPLPRAPVEGREGDLKRAREWLFPRDGR